MQSNTRAAETRSRGLNVITRWDYCGCALRFTGIWALGYWNRHTRNVVCYELSQMGLSFTREVHLPLSYKGLKLDCSYRIDLLVEDAIVVELKSIEQLLPIHSAQLLTYLRASHKQIGLLINFNVPVLKDGIKRIVNDFDERGPPLLRVPLLLALISASPRLCVE